MITLLPILPKTPDYAYQGNFSNWADVQNEFRTDEPEPPCVVYATYTYEDYSGDTCVVYITGDALAPEFHYVVGGHCSCHGLEDQWRPEAYSREVFVEMLKRMASSDWPDQHAKNILANMKEMGLL